MKALTVLVVIIVFAGCVSQIPEEPEAPQRLPEPQAPAEPEPIQPEPSGKVLETAPAEEEQSGQLEVFEVTEEVYSRTFDQIDQVIAELNMVIQKKDYETWLDFLTEEYVEKTSDPEYLARWRDDPVLKQKNIVLRDLRDFFDCLVVPTRANVRLDEIEFVDDTRVYAYTVYQGQKYLLYNLIKTEQGWKVDFY